MVMKTPPGAKRVFKGVIYDVYRWQQKMFDGTEETFETVKRAPNVEIIAVKDGKILITYQSQPVKKDVYLLLGGRVEEGENPLGAAKRELLEESGMSSDNWELYKKYSPLDRIDWDIYTYIARNCREAAEAKPDSGEKIKVLELSFEEFIKCMLSDKYWGTEMVIDILRMKEKGTLDKFKEKLLS